MTGNYYSFRTEDSSGDVCRPPPIRIAGGLAHADRMTVAQDRGIPAPVPHEMPLISTAYVDQPVRAQSGCLGLQRGDAIGLARRARKPEGGAPRIRPKIAHVVI